MTLCFRKFIIIIFLAGLAVFSVVSLPQRAVKADTASTSVTVLLVCGDGFKDAGEVCDPGSPPDIPADFGGLTCQDYGYDEGDLTCASDCSEIFTTMCNICGNGIQEGYEECDDSDFGGDTCLTYGFNTGNLSCTASCNLNTMGCSSVGLEEPEEGGSQGGGSGGGGRGGGGSGVVPGHSPGSDTPPQETKVVVKGKSYPGADIHILVDGKVIGIVKADSKADFYFETTDVTPGVAGFGVWAEDKNGIKSTLLTLTFRIISGAVTTISGAYLSPTIDTDQQSVKKGDVLKIFGQTIPETEVYVHINSEEKVIERIDSNEGGDWTLDFDTAPLKEEEFHTTKALFQTEVSGNVIKSGFSRTISFFVGKTGLSETCPGADLNKDNRVNLIDFSILLYHWGSDDPCADQNQNKKVDLIDFSILLYHWTG